jgi:uncharacterized membrane protein YdbT with pleckstrin-like domain
LTYPDYSGGLLIKPSYVPFVGRWITAILLIFFAFAAVHTEGLLPIPSGAMYLIDYALLIVGIISLLGTLLGVARRNAYSYTITNTGIIVKKQLFRRSVRQIPFTSISDVYVNQTIIGRLANYGNVVPVTKSGYGIVPEMEYSSEATTSEMTDVSRPDEVAEIIMQRIGRTSNLMRSM